MSLLGCAREELARLSSTVSGERDESTKTLVDFSPGRVGPAATSRGARYAWRFSAGSLVDIEGPPRGSRTITSPRPSAPLADPAPAPHLSPARTS